MGLFHPLSLTRTVRDPIHGNISLTEEEMGVINHPLFRRLHRVRQNGLLYLVFPSASHTRFEHSLGVLFVADAMLQALFSNSLTAQGKSPRTVAPLESAELRQAVDISQIDSKVSASLFRYSRLAALVHDLGHGPLSHYFDPFAPRSSAIREICEREPRLGYLLKVVPIEGEQRVEHELMSCTLFTRIAEDLALPEEDAQVVAAVIQGTPELCPLEGFRSYIALLHDIVASAPADADRMDYLERDSRSLGVSYGLYDRNRLLKSFLAYKSQEGLRLGIKKSGARAVENFVQARFELFVQIYYHKTNRAIQLMLKRIADHAANLKDQIFPWTTLGDLISTYEELSDERFLRVLRGKDLEWKLENDVINHTAEQIYKRELWKRVFEGPNGVEVDDAVRKLSEKSYECIPDKEVDPTPTKDLDTGAGLLTRNGQGVYSFTERPWKDESVIIAALPEAKGKLARVYLASSDPKDAREAREELGKGGS